MKTNTVQFVCYFAIASCAVWVLCESVRAQDGTFVAGVAVYRDAKSQDNRRAAGLDLMLVSGSYEGKLSKKPSTVVDEDTTSKRSSGYRKEDEGIFYLYSKDTLRFVSLVYYQESLEGEGPQEPAFFSTIVPVRPFKDASRLVGKLELELWPTDAHVATISDVKRILRGIVLTHYVMRQVTEVPAEEDTRNLLAELRTLASLIPANQRAELLREAMSSLTAFLRDYGVGAEDVMKMIPSADDDFWRGVDSDRGREDNRWAQVREAEKKEE